MQKSAIVIVLSLIMFSVFAMPVRTVNAADDTTKRRPDRAEFVTKSHVRLTTESLTIAKVTEATPSPDNSTNLLDFISQSLSALLQFLRDILNLNQ